MEDTLTYDDLPGSEILGPALRDLRAGRLTVEALMVLDGATALREVGVDVPPLIPEGDAGLLAHERLVAEMGLTDGHARYRDLRARLVAYRDAAGRLFPR